ncbi:hypothetical protein [Actinomadura sp. B10D3]|uniref:hypothetical protein n=1 Tax=Actinomadura sp. B10D3 TaxID=3153557 RepID=UPI00325D36BA
MTVVVVVGDVPSTGITPGSVAQRVPDAADPAALLTFLDGTSHALARAGAVLVVHPAWRSEAAVKLVRQARMLLATDRIARMPLDLPPLALSLVADQLAYTAPHVPAGVLASIAPHLADRLVAGAWLASVAKLERGQAKLGQHMLSYLPGSGFMVTSSAETTVHRITGAKPVQDITRRPLDPVLMLAANEQGDLDWLEQRLRPALQAVRVTNVAAPPLSAEFWGSRKYTEFVAFSGHPHDLHQVLQAVRCVRCPWCGEPTALPACPFCGETQPRADAPHQPGAQPGPQPRPEARPGPQAPPGAPPAPAQPAPAQPASPAPNSPPAASPAAPPASPAPSVRPVHPAQPAVPRPADPHPPSPPGTAPQAFGEADAPGPRNTQPDLRKPLPADPEPASPAPLVSGEPEEEERWPRTVEFRPARHP